MTDTFVSSTRPTFALSAPDVPAVKAGFIVPRHHDSDHGLVMPHVTDVTGMRIVYVAGQYEVTVERGSKDTLNASVLVFRHDDRRLVDDVAARLMAQINTWRRGS